MAMSEKTALRLWASVAALEDHPAEVVKFAQAVEAEVQKQDTALIRQMVEALENHQGNYKLTAAQCVPVDAAVTAARARLESKP